MNEQAEQALAQLLDKAVSGVDNAVEFSQAQIPDVIEQLLMWHMVESGIWFGFGVLLWIPLVYFLRMVRRDWEKLEESAKSDAAEVTLFFGAVPAFIGIFTMSSNLEWLQILIAPKLYLLEYAAELVK